ncbi:hypothetical protein K439DRAFT_1243753, partial [Ramaria rubella]
SAILEITNETVKYINEWWGHLLGWDETGIMHPICLHMYADSLRDFGAPAASVFGCIDRTICLTCHPRHFQELVYTGYKKCHSMKFQGVVI